MKDSSVAFYFIGHGPRREPRLIELQHLRVLRYRSLARHQCDQDGSPQIFIDLNHERITPAFQLQESFPQLHTLISIIREGRIGIVYLDLRESQSPSVDYSWVTSSLRAAGADVINVYDDEDHIFEDALKRLYGPDASSYDVDQASDFACFFPQSALRITQRSLGAGRMEVGDTSYHLYQLDNQNPYAAGRVPFVEARLERIWQNLRMERLRTEESERRKIEFLYLIGPGKKGLLINEGCINGARNSESLAWAEKRVCEDLKFTKVEESRYISYQREVDACTVFADIREERRITFYLFVWKVQGRNRSSTASFFLQDRVKSDLERRWSEGFRHCLSL